jgi:STE24 endopeptidase
METSSSTFDTIVIPAYNWCRYEFQADGFAVSLQHADNLTEALKILDKENKSDFVVDWFFSQYHYSHPPLIERLRAIARAAKKAL